MKNTPLILALLLLFLVSCKDEKQQEVEQDVTTETPDLIADSGNRKAFTTDNLNMQTFTLDAGKDNTIKGEKGTELTIPKNTFTDAQGNLVTGNITVQLKEALSISDIVTGGLTTTSNGEILSSGGMLYVNAKQGDNDVFIGKSKSIGVSVPTDNFVPEMQIFTGNEDADGNINWIEPKDIIKKPVAKPTPNKTAKPTKAAKPTQGDMFGAILDYVEDGDKDDTYPAPYTKPLKPYKNDGGIVIAVNIDNPELLPEFIPFSNVSWKLVDESAFSKEDNGKDWKHVSVKRSAKDNIYVLTFKGTEKNSDEIKEYEVYPVLEGEEYEVALADYNKKIAAYEKEMKLQEEKRKSEERDLINISKAEDFANDYIFEVTRLGWVNCDYFYRNANPTDVLVRTTINNTSENNVYAYMVIKEDKVCLAGFPDENGDFMFGYPGNPYIKMPLGIKVTILGVSAQEDGTLKFASKDVTITKETSVLLELKQATEEDMKKAIETGTINT